MAADVPRLAKLRTGLRAEMQASPLMDEPGFARKIEAAYREMFALWASQAIDVALEREDESDAESAEPRTTSR
jgi:hypothetical protein